MKNIHSVKQDQQRGLIISKADIVVISKYNRFSMDQEEAVHCHFKDNQLIDNNNKFR